MRRELRLCARSNVPFLAGKIEIPVKTLQFDVPVEKWYTLQPLTAGGRHVHGEIFLKLHLTKG